jgi:transcriptional regulator with XRE-family HTH domain
MRPPLSDVSRQVGRRLRARRRALGLTQGELARAVGISYQQFQKYEKGHNALSPYRLSRLARALDVPIHYFFLEWDSPAPPPPPFPLTPLEVDVLEAYRHISDRSIRRRISHLAHALVEAAAAELP